MNIGIGIGPGRLGFALDMLGQRSAIAFNQHQRSGTSYLVTSTNAILITSANDRIIYV
jgi:hypothetical protein